MRGHGVLFTLISCYLWAQLRLMQVLALLFHAADALDGGMKWIGEKKIQEEWNTVTWGSRWSPWHILGAKAAISHSRSWSGVKAHSRFLSSFHPHPHLLLLPLIGSDWIWPSDAKHAQRPAWGPMAETCKTQTCTATKDTLSSMEYYYIIIIKGLTGKDHPFLNIWKCKQWGI